ncbi:MAG: cupin domain-containing protein [Treponema sp.]|nr:cupin domain-containing protein [Treponema sp.]
MLNQRGLMKTETKLKMRDGEGSVNFTYLADCEKERNIRMLAEAVLPPGASIGYHRHDNETEYYLILSGTGEVNDDGTVKPVKAGDAMITGDGASHSIKNTGSVPLVFHAVIVTH